MKEKRIKNNKKRIFNKVLIIILWAVVVFICMSNVVYGHINETYGQNYSDGFVDINKAITDSTVIRWLAWFVYTIARFIEKVIKFIVEGITSDSYFPYSDTIVFNGVRFLDINFISPSEGSLFKSLDGKSTLIGKIVSSIYYTVFFISITLMSIAVIIAAIKLSVSSIANEKAKYKIAIKNWVIAVILVFTTSYLISFLFFVNEKLVEIASNIFLDSTKKYDVVESAKKETVYIFNIGAPEKNSGGKIVRNDKVIRYVNSGINGQFKEFTLSYDETGSDGKPINGAVTYTAQITQASRKCPYFEIDYIDSVGNDIKNNFYDYEFVLGSGNNNLVSYEKAKKWVEGMNKAIIDGTYMDYTTWGYEASQGGQTNSDQYKTVISEDMTDYFKSFANQISMDLALMNGQDVGASAYTFVLSSQFNDNIVDKNGDINPVMALLYFIFIVQSIMFLVAYVKRLIYIITLAMFAPIVVVYDFIAKNMK